MYKIGLVYRNKEGILLLLKPWLREAKEISDYEKLYTNLPISKVEVVYIEDEISGIYILKSIGGQTFFKLNKEVPAYEVIDYIMSDQQLTDILIKMLNDDYEKDIKEYLRIHK